MAINRLGVTTLGASKFSPLGAETRSGLGNLYFVSGSTLYKWKASDASQVWSVDLNVILGATVTSVTAPGVADADHVYFAATVGGTPKLVRIAQLDGSLSYQTPTGSLARMVGIYPGGDILCNGRRLAATGASVWSTTIDIEADADDAGNYFARDTGNNNRVRRYNATTGAQVATAAVPNPTEGSPTRSAAVLYGGADGAGGYWCFVIESVFDGSQPSFKNSVHHWDGTSSTFTELAPPSAQTFTGAGGQASWSGVPRTPQTYQQWPYEQWQARAGGSNMLFFQKGAILGLSGGVPVYTSIFSASDVDGTFGTYTPNFSPRPVRGLLDERSNMFVQHPRSNGSGRYITRFNGAFNIDATGVWQVDMVAAGITFGVPAIFSMLCLDYDRPVAGRS